MLIDEARLASRIRHPNVVPTLDVVATPSELLVIMDYVPGESLSRLWRACGPERRIPLPIASAILCGVLHGLHAAHEATDEAGAPLDLVHRDVSPQNILVGADGVARLLDFGIAKASNRAEISNSGRIKGKIGYMPPEQVTGEVTRRSDVFSTGVVLWEMLTGKRLFYRGELCDVTARVEKTPVTPPTQLIPDLPPAIDAIVMRSLEARPDRRYAKAREMACELEACLGMASPRQVADWVGSVAAPALAERAAAIMAIEKLSLPEPPDEASALKDVAGSTEPRAELEVPNHAKRRRVQAGVVGIACVAIALVATALRGRSGSANVSASIVPTASVAPRGSPTNDEPPVEPAPPAPMEALSSMDGHSAAASSAALPPSAQSTSEKAGASQPRVVAALPGRARAPALASVAVDCSPPFSLDAKGHKIWKTACFRK